MTQQPVAFGERLALLSGSDHSNGFTAFSADQPLIPDYVFDPATAAWTELPMDPHRPAYDRIGTSFDGSVVLLSRLLIKRDGGALVNIGEQAADGGGNEWGRQVFEAWGLDVTAGTWSPLPERPERRTGHRTIGVTVGGARFVAKGNWLYDAVGTPAWVDSASGGSLLVWGGSRWEGKHAADGAAQLPGDGWRLVIAGATR